MQGMEGPRAVEKSGGGGVVQRVGTKGPSKGTSERSRHEFYEWQRQEKRMTVKKNKKSGGGRKECLIGPQTRRSTRSILHITPSKDEWSVPNERKEIPDQVEEHDQENSQRTDH